MIDAVTITNTPRMLVVAMATSMPDALAELSGIHNRFGIPPLASNSIGCVGPRAPALMTDNETRALAGSMARAATAKWSGA